MRPVLLLMSLLLLALPALAADKPVRPVTQPRLIARIDSLIATVDGNAVLIQARGAVDSGGWRQGQLRAVKTSIADASTIVVEFVALPPAPTQAVIEGLIPIHATTSLPMRRGVVSVRVISGSNEITSQILK